MGRRRRPWEQLTLPAAPPDVCPWCGVVVPDQDHGRHTRDTGDAQTLPAGACPVLFARRNGRPA